MSVTVDPYLFQIGVTALPGVDLSKVESSVDHELERLREEPVSIPELDRAMRQLESQFVYSSEGVTNQAFWLGQWDIVDSWRRAGTLPDEIRAVSAADVQRVAQRYLVPERRTVGWLVPDATDGAVVRSMPEAPDPASSNFDLWGLAGPHVPGGPAAQGFLRAVLPNGIPVLGQERPDSRSVALRIRIPAGSIRESLKESGIAHLTGRSLLRGSGGRSFEEINTRTDELGSSISIDTGREFLEARGRALREDFREIADLLAQTLQRPDFPGVEVERVKAEQLGAIVETDNDTRAIAERIMRRGIYPEPNPLGRRVLGGAEKVAEFDMDDVRAFHTRAIGPTGASIAVVGGIDGFEGAVDALSESFGSWEGPSRAAQTVDLTTTNSTTIRMSEEIPGKSQADIAVGIATVPRGHPDYYALDVGNLILGRLGLMGRLGAEVRDRQGLAYYAFSQLEPRNDGGLWGARAGLDPANINRAVDAIASELARLRSDLVSQDELEDAKSYLIGVLPLALETHDGVAATLLAIEEFGLGLDFLDRYPEFISQVSREGVRRAAREHLDPARLAIGIAGPIVP